MDLKRLSRKVALAGLATCAALAAEKPAAAQELLVWSPAGSIGYGDASYTAFAGFVASAFDGVTVTTSVSDLETLLSYDRLFVNTGPIGSGMMSATDIFNIAAFAATGRRVVLLGENSSWFGWNASLAQIVGGTVTDGCVRGAYTPLFSHELTTDAGAVEVICGSSLQGGVNLFNHGVMALWGTSQNVLTQLDYNAMQNDYNQAYSRNVANWLAAGTPTEVVPEPITMVLLGSGLVGVGGVARRRRKPTEA